VLTVVEATGVGMSSGVPGTVVYSQLETWQGGKVTAIRYFTNEQAGVEAAKSRLADRS
jgi:hypothetical protein